jgi:AsmA protein
MLTIKRFQTRLGKSKIPLLVIGVFLILIAVPFLLPNAIYKDAVESKLEEATGLDFNLDKGFQFSLLPSIRLDANDVFFNGQVAQGVQVVGSIQSVHLDMQFWQFLRGNINLDNFLMVEPKVTIDGDFSPYLPDWIRTRLSASRKDEIRYVEILRHFIEDSILKEAKIEEGSFLWKKNAHTSIDIQKATLDILKPAHNKDLSIQGNAYVNNRTLDIKVRLERPDDFLRGYRSKMSFNIDSSPMQVEYIGSAAKRQTFVSQGDLRVEIPSLYDFCSWFSESTECDKKEGNLLLVSALKIRDQRLQIENANYTQSPFSAKLNGAIDFKTSKPEVTGTIQIPSMGVSKNTFSADQLRKLDLNDLLLDTFRANVDVLYEGHELASGEILKPKLKIRLEEGRLSLSIDQLKVFGGLVSARMRWHNGLENGYMDTRLDLSSIDLGRVQKEIKYDAHLQGALNTSIEIQSEGATSVALMETATIRGDFSILDGSIIGHDIASALNGQTSNSFDFTELKGRIQGNRGQLLSENLTFLAPSVNVSGTVNFDFLNNALNINLNSLNDVSEPPQHNFVQITGPLNDLVLKTSLNGEKAFQQDKGLLSGLLPYDEENKEPALGNQEIVIEETDLLE